jgi:hypothetical protein
MIYHRISEVKVPPTASSRGNRRDASRRGGGQWNIGTFSPTGQYSSDGGACFSGRPTSTPQLHRKRAPTYPLIAGKRAAPAAADGLHLTLLYRPRRLLVLGKTGVHSPPSTETHIAPASRSSATPRVLPATFQPRTTAFPLSRAVQSPSPDDNCRNSTQTTKEFKFIAAYILA